MKKFLKLKPWQLFGILMVIPMIFPVVIMASIVANNDLTPVFAALSIHPAHIFGVCLINPAQLLANLVIPTGIFVAFLIVMALSVGLLLMWFYSLGTNLPKKLPPTLTMNPTKFKLFLFVSIACKLVLAVFIVMLGSKILAGEQLNAEIFAFLIPLHLFSTCCVVYCLYFIAKALKTVELQKPVVFSDFAVEFFLLLFFPVGIWFIQPKINHLFNN